MPVVYPGTPSGPWGPLHPDGPHGGIWCKRSHVQCGNKAKPELYTQSWAVGCRKTSVLDWNLLFVAECGLFSEGLEGGSDGGLDLHLCKRRWRFGHKSFHTQYWIEYISSEHFWIFFLFTEINSRVLIDLTPMFIYRISSYHPNIFAQFSVFCFNIHSGLSYNISLNTKKTPCLCLLFYNSFIWFHCISRSNLIF